MGHDGNERLVRKYTPALIISTSLEEKPQTADQWPRHRDSCVAIELIFAPDSVGRSEWMTLIHREVNNLELTARE
jgi:hypothetical protein